MHFATSLLLVASITPSIVASPSENSVFRRTGEDGKDKDWSPYHKITSTVSSTGNPERIASKDLVSPGLLTTETPVPVSLSKFSTFPTLPALKDESTMLTDDDTLILTFPAKDQSAKDMSVDPMVATGPSSLPSSFAPTNKQSPSGLYQMSSKPEVSRFGTGALSSKDAATYTDSPFPSPVSLNISAFLDNTGTHEIPGFGIVPSPTSTPGDKGPLSNATTSVVPIFSPDVLGNAYGGGFANTPSLYATPLPYPDGPKEGIPPGYGQSFRPKTHSGAPIDSFNTSKGDKNSDSVSKGSNLSISYVSGNRNNTKDSTLTSSTTALTNSRLANEPTTSLVASNFATAVSYLQTQLSTSGTPAGGNATSAGSDTENLSSYPYSASYSLVGGLKFPGFTSGSLSQASKAESGGESSAGSLSTENTINAFTGVAGILPVHFTATVKSGQLVVQTSTPLPVLVNATAANGEGVTGLSTPPATVVSSTASDDEVIIGSSTPLILSSHTATSGEIFVSTVNSVPVIAKSNFNSGDINYRTSTPSLVLVSSAVASDKDQKATLESSPILITSTATNGIVSVKTSTLPLVILASTLSNDETAAQTVTSSAVLTSITASSGEIIVGPSSAVSIEDAQSTAVQVISDYLSKNGSGNAVPKSVAEITSAPSVVGSPIVIAIFGRPSSQSQQVGNAPVTLVDEPSGKSGHSFGQNIITAATGLPSPTAGVLTPTVDSEDLTPFATGPSTKPADSPSPIVGISSDTTSLIPSPTSPIAGLLTPIFGVNGQISYALVSSAPPGEEFTASAHASSAILSLTIGPGEQTSLTTALIAKGTSSTTRVTQPSATILTPVIGLNGLTSLAVAVSFKSVDRMAPSDEAPAASLTPVRGDNGYTPLAVIPSPVVGPNGRTSLAVYSTPVAAALGLSSPAVMLTPVVGVDGSTSLAVVATPVVGNNGETSLAIGLQGEQGPSSTPSPTQGFIPIRAAAAGSEQQSGTQESPIALPLGASGILSATSGSLGPIAGNGDNSSVHLHFRPTAMVPFESSASEDEDSPWLLWVVVIIGILVTMAPLLLCITCSRKHNQHHIYFVRPAGQGRPISDATTLQDIELRPVSGATTLQGIDESGGEHPAEGSQARPARRPVSAPSTLQGIGRRPASGALTLHSIEESGDEHPAEGSETTPATRPTSGASTLHGIEGRPASDATTLQGIEESGDEYTAEGSEAAPARRPASGALTLQSIEESGAEHRAEGREA